MADNGDYPFRLIDFLKIKYDKEGRDYVEYLLTMYKATSIDDMITVYDKMLEKISYYVFCRSTPRHWFITDSWGKKKYLAYELNKCLNENIKRWYVSLENPTKEDCVSCIVNLRESDNKNPVQNAIFSHKQFECINGSDIIALRDKSYMVRRKTRSMYPGNKAYFELEDEDEYDEKMNGYFEQVDKYNEIMNELKSLGYKYTIVEKNIEEMEILNVEDRVKKKEEWLKEKEERVKIEKKNKREARIFNIILVVLSIILFIFIAYLIKKIGLLGIIIAIGLIGAIPKFILKGKF